MRVRGARARGYALSELLVAVAIAGLIIGVLTFLNVDYVQLGRRVSELQTPYKIGANIGRLDPCGAPGAVLSDDGGNVIAKSSEGAQTLVSLATEEGAPTQVTTPNGVAGASSRPVRLVVEGTAAPGGSIASLEVAGATAAVIAPRCDASQVCDFDAINAVCFQDEAPVAHAG